MCLPRKLSTFALPILLAWGPFTYARQKSYQTTKLIELEAGTADFCFVVQVDEIAYLAIAHDRPSKMIVGDPIQIRIKDDNLFIKTVRQWKYDGDEVKGKIKIRKRVTTDGKLPSCALAVTIH